MSNKSLSEELRWYLSIVIRWAWLIILITVAAGAVAYLVCRSIRPTYQAAALVLIQAPTLNSDDYSAVMTSERLAKTYAERMTTRPILEGVIKRLGLTTDIATLAKAVKVAPVRDTQLIEVQVETNDPAQAATIANTLVAEFSEKNIAQQASRYAVSKKNLEAQLAQLNQQIQATGDQINRLGTGNEAPVEQDRLNTTLAQYRQTYGSLLQSYEQVRLAEAQLTSNIILEEPANPPVKPIGPRVLINTLLAAAMGLLLGVGIAFLFEVLDDSIRSPEQVTRLLGQPVLGVITHQEMKGAKPFTILHPRDPIAEAFRSLRTNIDFISAGRPLRALLVASPTPEEGKSTIAANLAIILAQSDRRVILVDADLRRPAVHQQLGLPNQRGLSDLFLLAQRPKEAVETILQTTELPRLRLLAAGSIPPNPAELIGSEMMSEILTGLTQSADMIVIDSSPILAVTDASVLAPRVDGVVLVVKPGATKLDACRQTIEQLQRAGARILGVVLNDVQRKHAPYTGYRYTGQYAYDESNKKL